MIIFAYARRISFLLPMLFALYCNSPAFTLQYTIADYLLHMKANLQRELAPDKRCIRRLSNVCRPT